jgi:aminopeptidase N
MGANEPEAAMTWYPVSDHPTDKATYDIAVTVPAGKVAVANGLPAGPPVTRGGWTRWAWHAPDPMASYLSTASVGDYTLTSSQSPAGTRILDAVDDGLTTADRATTKASLAKQGAMLDYFSSTFTPYPFVAAGAIVDDDSVGYALETQTRPIYSLRAREGTVAHELAHQWFGDSVSPARWRDIWLNEGWATYCSWLWAEHSGGQSVQAAFDDVLSIPADDGFWTLDVTDPQPLGLFDDAVYDRGAAALHALRLEIGDRAFFAGARLWLTRYEGRTATTEDFQRVYEEVSGRDLGAFLDTWLRTPARPAT